MRESYVNGWGSILLWVFLVFPLSALLTFGIRITIGWGEAGWQDFIIFVVLSTLIGGCVDALLDRFRVRGQKPD